MKSYHSTSGNSSYKIWVVSLAVFTSICVVAASTAVVVLREIVKAVSRRGRS